MVSPFDSSIRRPTRETAELRTRFVLSLAESKTIIHAQPGGLIAQNPGGELDSVGLNKEPGRKNCTAKRNGRTSAASGSGYVRHCEDGL
jgi:hypothetical protein